jgi:hypothetical protein
MYVRGGGAGKTSFSDDESGALFVISSVGSIPTPPGSGAVAEASIRLRILKEAQVQNPPAAPTPVAEASNR